MPKAIRMLPGQLKNAFTDCSFWVSSESILLTWMIMEECLDRTRVLNLFESIVHQRLLPWSSHIYVWKTFMQHCNPIYEDYFTVFWICVCSNPRSSCWGKELTPAKARHSLSATLTLVWQSQTLSGRHLGPGAWINLYMMTGWAVASSHLWRPFFCASLKSQCIR